MLKKIGAETIITRKKEELHEAEKIILPGVGTFDHGMECLTEAGLSDIIRSETLEYGKPLLGIWECNYSEKEVMKESVRD